MTKAKVYIKAILFPVIIGGIVGFIISKFMDYNSLIKPVLAPPSVLFPIVWTILYILMGISYGRLKLDNLNDDKIKRIYYLQLLVNVIWPILFFVFKWRFISFLWIGLLDVIVGMMVYAFYQKDKLSGILQIPYLMWSLFASYLNLAIFLLNK